MTVPLDADWVKDHLHDPAWSSSRQARATARIARSHPRRRSDRVGRTAGPASDGHYRRDGFRPPNVIDHLLLGGRTLRAHLAHSPRAARLDDVTALPIGGGRSTESSIASMPGIRHHLLGLQQGCAKVTECTSLSRYVAGMSDRGLGSCGSRVFWPVLCFSLWTVSPESGDIRRAVARR